AGLHDRPPSGRGRRAVWWRTGDGAETRADLPRARRDRSRARDAADRDPDLAAGDALHAGRGAAVERSRAHRAFVRAIRRVRREREGFSRAYAEGPRRAVVGEPRGDTALAEA